MAVVVHHKSAGFTLIELVIVIFIVGVISTVTVLSVDTVLDRSAKKDHQTFLQQLQQMIDLAAEAAVMQQKEFGLDISPANVRLMSYEAGTWQHKRYRELINQLTIPSEGNHQLFVSGYRVKIVQRKPDGPSLPEILILSTGEMTPFEWSFIKGEENFALLASPLGRMQLTSDNND